ncbi:MAG: hypothetical protein COU08_00620 [Candidatus Harrisonbacteria bacterium CG10_big_fil_rev_8_21_14_0_10_42_17]|uniref:Uncharacterized protein n=1 Tax=Candidatus Harrisonbacteria bacterium CG10_big_fil_rev_8_21_14_0_10_42_17 TaxID=1974584 RepID=A0A2M6WIZ0_9BACT|nr:MAG: hypothetical protein COU08_00620 [Candidatus Harrisonbacteria bacterium CG10_big_fil_rev_8_21_14_0_10_42_17]
MYSFLLQIILFSSLGVVIYILSRAVERVPDDREVAHTPGVFDRMLRALPLAEADRWINTTFEKLLRKTRVNLLKIDNLINKGIDKVRRNSSVHASRHDSQHQLFREDVDERDGSDEV